MQSFSTRYDGLRVSATDHVPLLEVAVAVLVPAVCYFMVATYREYKAGVAIRSPEFGLLTPSRRILLSVLATDASLLLNYQIDGLSALIGLQHFGILTLSNVF